MTKVKNRSIKDAVSQLGGVFLNNYATFVLCNVESVDETNCTCSCTPISGPAITGLENVLLQAEANDGLLLIPSVNSTVIVGTSNTDLPFVVMFEDIDKVKLKIGGSILEVTDGLFKFNGGSNGGMALMLKLVDQYNKIENKVNDLISKYNSHTHAGVTSGSSSTAIPSAIEAGTLTLTKRTDIENTAITQ